MLTAVTRCRQLPRPRRTAGGMSHTEGIDNVMIHWDDDDGEYSAGQLLTGTIQVRLVSHLAKIRQVKICF